MFRIATLAQCASDEETIDGESHLVIEDGPCAMHIELRIAITVRRKLERFLVGERQPLFEFLQIEQTRWRVRRECIRHIRFGHILLVTVSENAVCTDVCFRSRQDVDEVLWEQIIFGFIVDEDVGERSGGNGDV